MKIPIVDKNDKIIGYKDRSEVNYKTDIFRTASVWITNNKGEALLAQRKFDKKVDAGKWGESVGGTVENDDSYLDTAIRESYEELGISDIKLTVGPKQFLETATYSCQIQWYKACINKELSDFIVQEEEVEQIAWFPLNKIKEDIKKSPEKYASDFSKCVELLLEN